MPNFMILALKKPLPAHLVRAALVGLLALLCQGGAAQFNDVNVKVYDFEAGLSHRSVFKITQDTAGFIWMATINGLNRFDGYRFVTYSSTAKQHRIPFDAISDMHIDASNHIWLANPDHITHLNPHTGQAVAHQIKPGSLARRESWVPHNLFLDAQERLWMASFDEKSAQTHIQAFDTQTDSSATLFSAEGQYTRRPIAQVGERYYVGAHEHELWQVDAEGCMLKKTALPLTAPTNRSQSRIVQLEAAGSSLWVLLADGRLFQYDTLTDTYQAHPLNRLLPRRLFASALMLEADGDVWIGGLGYLLYYSAQSGRLINYDDLVRQIVKNTVSYRHIYQDKSNTIWISSDFGAIRLVQSEALFSHYLSGGSEYCSNIYCSTRGITEDASGNIYVSYYNAIHVLDPAQNTIRPLFRSNDYFNYPFGMTWHDGALWTCNGLRIDLATMAVDTVFHHSSIDLGDVLLARDGYLWFGYQGWLYRYDSKTKTLEEFQHLLTDWDKAGAQVSQLYQGDSSDDIWVATLGHGVYRFNPATGQYVHFKSGDSALPGLAHPQVNVVYEDGTGHIWIGGPNGLQRIHLSTNASRLFTTADGLPHNFINGILPEGDSCLWVSTNNGLARFHKDKLTCTSFYTDNGLSSNEFNRISFYGASDGRMYFGGMNGVNAFYPGEQFLREAGVQQQAPVLFTGFTRLDGSRDSLIAEAHGLYSGMTITLSHLDKLFAFEFALADYRHPSQNMYSYLLEGYEKDWSEPTGISAVRYNNIPAGRYTFRVRAHTGQGAWSTRELLVHLVVRQAFYRSWWFVALCLLAAIAVIYAMVRYRIYNIQKRREELELIVKSRTLELQQEKQKSDELLLNILPVDIAEELKAHGHAKARRHELVTVMFSDFEGFSRIAERMQPEDLVAEIDFCFRAFDEIVDKYGLEKIKTVGDAYLCVEGIASNDTEEAVKVVQAALDIQAFLQAAQKEKELAGQPFFRARIGIHTGPVVAGIVGIKKFAYDIWGDTVNIASRMETYGEVGRVNISQTTHDLVSKQYPCKYHGAYTEGNAHIDMYLVQEPSPAANNSQKHT